MEWPHDPDGEEGSEGKRLYGQAIFAKKVSDEDFPLTFEEFREEVGHHPIRIDHETVVAAADILAGVDEETASDRIAFHRAIGEAMRSDGHWTYDPVVEAPGSR